MKKYFITAVAALALGGLMTSCTKDKDFSGGTTQSSQDIQKTYEEAFLSTFGRPVEGLNWGFGPSTTASTRAMTRTLQPSHNFSNDIPSKPSTNEMVAANFKENVDGIDPYTSDYDIGISYITGSINVNIYGGGGTQENGWQKSGGEVYFTGTCDMSDKSVYICDNTIIYIVKGAQVTLDNGFQGNCKVYIAEGAKLTIKNNIGTGNVSYYIKGGSFEAKNNLVVNGGKEFYVEDGSVKVGGLMQIENATYYAKNTPLIIDGYLDLVNRDNSALFYNEGGTITCKNELKNNSSKFYSSGNSKFKEIEGNGISVIYNAANAVMESESKIRVTNSNGNGTNGSVLINDGTLKGTYLGTEGSSFFQNNGTTTISGGTEDGNTVINSNNNTWVNNNQYVTKYFNYTAGSSEVINNCNLTVNEDFYMNIGDGSGDFKIDAGGGVLTKNFYGGGTGGGPFKITMGARSVFKVTNDCYLDATASGIATNGYGFQGVGVGDNNAAVLDAKYVKNHGNPGHGYVAYSGNLYVSAESHFAQGTEGAADGASYIIFKGGCTEKNIYAPGFENGKPSIEIDQTTCNPGFNGDTTPPGPGVDTDASEVIVIAEDLSTYVSSDGKELADFDFNDVVFEVSKNHNESCTNTSGVHIKLLAAGGTLPLTVGGTVGEAVENHDEQVLAYEVHRLFKVSTGTMVNTNATTSGTSKDPVEFDIPYPDGVTSANNIYEIANAIPIRVNRTDLDTGEKGWIEIQKAEAVSSSATRITASKLCVDKTYVWCNERVHIDNVFPYTDAYGNNKGSRFRMYLSGELQNYWWRQSTTVESE